MANKRVYFVSLGCPKNQVDTEVMLGVVNGEGHDVVDSPDEADTLVVNTCGFIDAAKEESIDTILALSDIKAKGDDKKLVVTGCLSQRYADQLANEMPEVDHFLGSADMLGLQTVLRGQGKRMGVSELGKRAYLYDHATPRTLSGPQHSAYVKIAEGCDRPCAFCIIPKLRGAQRSRTVYSVVEEASALAANGTKEICLVGQDLTAYGEDLDVQANLEMLLDALVRVDGLEWIRMHYAYPTGVTDGIIERIASEPKIATYLDVPIQHVDTDVLKKMRRGYTEKVVRNMVDRLRDAEARSGGRLWLRTTLLTGHPGETEEAFERLEAFVGDGGIDHLGVFPWSREEGTAAAMQPGRVPEEVARERADRLMDIQADHRTRRHAELEGTTVRVLVEGESTESEYLYDARHEGQAPEIDGKVILTDAPAGLEVGEMVEAVVTQTGPDDLVATLEG